MTAESVTERNSALGNAESAGAAKGPTTSGPSPKTLHSALTERYPWLVGVARRAAEEFRLPSLFTEQAPAVQTLRRYAHDGLWTRKPDGLVRALGIAWCYGIGIPVTVYSRYREWLWQRPSRAIFGVLTMWLLAQLPPVAWSLDHLVKPLLHTLIDLL